VLVFTDNANNSAEIKKELALASQNKLAVIPARAEDVVPTAALAYELATRQWINLFQDWENEIENLCTRVRQIVPAPSPEATPPQQPAEPIAEPVSRLVAAAKQPAAARAVPLLLALVLTIFGFLRLGLSSIFLLTMMSRDWQLTFYLLAADTLTTGLLIVIAGILLMATARRWAVATALAICTVALLHDAVWLGVWYLVHPNAPAEPVVFHFGPMVACVIAFVSILAIQIWRHTAELRRNLGRRGDLAPSTR
jgi:hypothetical protein